MTQYNRENPVTAPHSGAEFAADFNKLLEAVLSGHSGSSRPANIAAGGTWVQTLTSPNRGRLYMYDGSTDIEILTVDYDANTVTLGATALDHLGTAATRNVGTAEGNLVEVLAGGLLPALDASNLTNLDLVNSEIPAPDHHRVVMLPTTLNGAGSYRSGGVIMADGSLRVWGNSDNGNLGQGSHYAYNRSAPIVPAFPGVYAGTPRKWLRHASENILLMENGEVWSWGQNVYGCLGHGNTANVFVPTKIAALTGINIIDVALGVSHFRGYSYAMFLADDGRLFACGNNANGELGLGDTTARSTPTALAKTDWAQVVTVGARAAVTFGIDASGDLYSWGEARRGELGTGVTSGQQTSPALLNAFGGVSVSKVHGHISGISWTAGVNEGHILALLSDGNVYSWGENAKGQLGLGDTTHRTIPTHVTSLGSDNVDVLAAFGNAGSSYVRKSNGEIWACGMNAAGQLGQGNTTDLNQFTLVPQIAGATGVVQMLAIGDVGSDAVAVLYDDGRIGGLGYNDDGRLGFGSNANAATMTEMLLPVSDKPVAICAVGQSGEAGIGIMTEDGKYYQTGYAGESQLPEDDDEPSSVPYLVQF